MGRRRSNRRAFGGRGPSKPGGRRGLFAGRHPKSRPPNRQYDEETLTSLLQNRLQSLSLSDVYDDLRASEPMPDVEIESETSYMVPFGGAVLRELAPTMSRALEEAPVYLALMRSERLVTTAALMGDAGRGFTVTVGALQPSGERHPMHIDWSQSGTEGASLAFSCARMARFELYDSRRSEPSLPTLQSVVSALQDVKDGDLGGSVDAANAILWNIERVLQALIIIATRRRPSETNVVISAPDFNLRKEQPPKETLLDAFDVELKRINRQKQAIVNHPEGHRGGANRQEGSLQRSRKECGRRRRHRRRGEDCHRRRQPASGGG